jgi:hypothetical protein
MSLCDWTKSDADVSEDMRLQPSDRGWLSDMLEFRIDGLIGAELLKTQTLTINLYDREIVLEERLLPAGSGIPLWDMSNVPGCRVACQRAAWAPGTTLQPGVISLGRLAG